MKWGGLGLAIVIAAFLWALGQVSPAALVGLLVLALVGFVFPPVALAIGGIVLLVLLMVHGQPIFAALQRMMGGGKA